MLRVNQPGWWYWAITSLLLPAARAGASAALPAAVALTLMQVAHSRWREGRFSALPVQVRLVYAALLLLALWPPLQWLLWLPAMGTPVLVLFGYCALGRCLSLLPWNRSERISAALVRRTFLTAPVMGKVL